MYKLIRTVPKAIWNHAAIHRADLLLSVAAAAAAAAAAAVGLLL